MSKKVSIIVDQISLENAWDYYQSTRDIIVQAAEQAKHSISGPPVEFDSRFFALSPEEVDRYVEKMLDETDKQACLFLIASAEAALRVDFFHRVYGRKRDDVSREFRSIYKEKRKHGKPKIPLDAILATWAEKVLECKSLVGDLRGAMNFRHWLAHGRWWVPNLGKNYDPAGILLIVTGLFAQIGLSAD